MAINPLTPKITDFLTHFCFLLPKRKKEYIMTKLCIHNIFWVSSFDLWSQNYIIEHWKTNMADFILKSTENLKFFFFKWIKDIDLFQTMDKGGQNGYSLWKIFFGSAHYVLSFPKWRKTMEIWKNTRFFMTFLR